MTGRLSHALKNNNNKKKMGPNKNKRHTKHPPGRAVKKRRFEDYVDYQDEGEVQEREG